MMTTIKITGKTFECKEKLKKCGLNWDGSGWVGTEERLTSYGHSKLSGICNAYDLTVERIEQSPAPVV